MSRIDSARPGRREGEDPDRRPRPRSVPDVGDAQPVLLGATAPAAVSATAPATGGEIGEDGPIPTRALAPVLAPPKAIPAGWPTKPATPVWAWLSQQRSPLPVLVAGAEGGVGTSTVTALVAETVAAGSPGPTVVLDQCGSPWGSLSRRLLGQRGGLAADQARGLLAAGVAPARVLRSAPSTSAGAAVLADAGMYVPLREVFPTAASVAGALIVDAGPVDLVMTARLELRPVLVCVGRADVIGAEAVCAALGLVSRYAARLRPIVVLTGTAPTDRRRVTAARKLVAAAGVQHVIELPFDARLATGQALRLDRITRTTATVCLRLVRSIATTQEVAGHGR